MSRSITGKMVVLTMVLSTSLWLVMEWFQGRELRRVFTQEMMDELIASSSDDRRLFDQKLREISSSVSLISAQKRFVEYVSSLSSTPSAGVIHHYASRPPVWMPKPSVMRVFFSARYALLLDENELVREVYHNTESGAADSQLLPSLLSPAVLLRKLSHNQVYLTLLDGFPYVIGAKDITADNGQRARLLLASPMDGRYLKEVVSVQTHGTVITLVDDASQRVLASSDETRIAVGVHIDDLQGRYQQAGKSFFDYGASDLTVQFASFIATDNVERRVNDILEMNSQQRTILVSVLFAAFMALTLWISMQIRRLGSDVTRRSQQVLGLQLVEGGAGDELACLRVQFERFASEVERMRSELQRELQEKSVLGDNLQQYNGNLQQLNAELERSKNTAECANRAKSDFLSSMSHELRTPLNAILGFSQLLEGDENLTAEQRESLYDIINAGSHLLELINAVLDLAKIEAGKMELSLSTVLLGDVMAAARKMIEPMAEKGNIRLTFSLGCLDGGYVHADFTRTKQVLLNLLSNAVKYNREGGGIQVDCRVMTNGRVRISVRDTGKGIAEVKLKGLFEAFNRLDAEGGSIEGTGIGLVITRQLVNLMGGEIGVESVVGEGSTFWFELPRAEEAVPREKSAVVPMSAQGEARFGAGRTMLYIEDNPINLKLVSKLVDKRTDIHLLSAIEPISGIELAMAHQPDLILLDINLPEMSGYEVLRHLREVAQTRDIPVVALSANAMADDLKKGEAAGFDGYLTKPINVKEFFRVLGEMLGDERRV